MNRYGFTKDDKQRDDMSKNNLERGRTDCILYNMVQTVDLATSPSISSFLISLLKFINGITEENTRATLYYYSIFLFIHCFIGIIFKVT